MSQKYTDVPAISNDSNQNSIDFIFDGETIQGRKLFKGGNYSWKYGKQNSYQMV